VLLAYHYASAVESGEAVRVAGFVLQPRTSPELLAGTAVAVLLLVVVSALLVMRGRLEGARVALDYAAYCSDRAYALASSLPAPWRHEVLRRHRGFVDLAHGDAKVCGVVLRMLLYAMTPLATLVLAAGALFVVNTPLTLLVLGILAVATPFLRRASIHGAAQRARLQLQAPEFSRQRRLLQERVFGSPTPVAPADIGRAMRHAMLGQQHAMESGKLIAQVAIGCALFVVLVIQGGATLSQESNWSALLAYVVALSFFGGSLAGLARTLVNINRFYPQAARYARFVASSTREAAAPPAAGGAYRLNAPRLEPDAGADDGLELRAGQRCALVVPREVTRYTAGLIGRLLQAGPTGAPGEALPLPWFANRHAPVGEGSLRECLGLPAECSREALDAELASLRADVRLPASLERPLTEAQRAALLPHGPFLLMALSGILNRRPLLILEGEGLGALDGAVRERLLERAAAFVTLVAYRADSSSQLGRHGETAVIIAGTNEVFGWAPTSTVLAGTPEVAQAMARAAAGSRPARGAALAEDDLEELG
jgi:hypothetical protein